MDPKGTGPRRADGGARFVRGVARACLLSAPVWALVGLIALIALAALG